MISFVSQVVYQAHINLSARRNAEVEEKWHIYAPGGSDWLQIEDILNFKIRFHSFEPQGQIKLTSDHKKSRFVQFGVNLTHFWPQSDSQSPV